MHERRHLITGGNVGDPLFSGDVVVRYQVVLLYSADTWNESVIEQRGAALFEKALALCPRSRD